MIKATKEQIQSFLDALQTYGNKGYVHTVTGLVQKVNYGGVGTELKLLLGKFGIIATDNCPCNQRAELMNKNGVKWCIENIETIVDWLQEEAHRRHLPFLRTAGKLLVKRAIKNYELKKNV